MIGGKKYEGLLADIWSCGIILYAMVCGFLPFEDQNTAILYKKILYGDFEVPDHLSLGIVTLLKAILNVDIKKRYRIEDIKKDKWFNQNSADPLTLSYFQINTHVLQEMKKYNIESATVIKSLEANAHDNNSTTYYLTYKKLEREGNLAVNEIIEKQETDKNKKEETLVKDAANDDYSNNPNKSIDRKEVGNQIENSEILKFKNKKKIINRLNVSLSLNRKSPYTSKNLAKNKEIMRISKYGMSKQALSISPDRAQIKSSKARSTKTKGIPKRGFGQPFSSNQYNKLVRSKK